MDGRPFINQVITGQPLIIITPYGTSKIEIMNILIQSLRRANYPNLIETDITYHLDDKTISAYQD